MLLVAWAPAQSRRSPRGRSRDRSASLVRPGRRRRCDARSPGRDRGGDREHSLFRLDAADLAEQRLEVLRLDGDHDERGTRYGLGVRNVTCTPWRSSSSRAAPRRAPWRRSRPARASRAQQSAQERLADRAGAQDRDAAGVHAASLGSRGFRQGHEPRRTPAAGRRSRGRPTRRRARAAPRSPGPRPTGPGGRRQLDQAEVSGQAALVPPEPLEADDPDRPRAEPALARSRPAEASTGERAAARLERAAEAGERRAATHSEAQRLSSAGEQRASVAQLGGAWSSSRPAAVTTIG